MFEASAKVDCPSIDDVFNRSVVNCVDMFSDDSIMSKSALIGSAGSRIRKFST